MKYKYVIFDFNGTLYWDTHLHNEAWNRFLEKHLISMADSEKSQVLHGKNNEEILRMVFGVSVTDSQIRSFILEKEGMYQQMCKETNLGLAPGVTSFLNFLKSRNVPFTIASASGIENINFYFDYLKLGQWFDYRQVVYNDGTLKSKPDPGFFLKAIEKLQANPSETLIFEDSPIGIKSALAAQPGKVVVVNSNPLNFQETALDVIQSFDEVNREWF
jgi:HAD superfamily hydrolase (TIGR01509 family)